MRGRGLTRPRIMSTATIPPISAVRARSMPHRRATLLALLPAIAGCYVYAPAARPLAGGDHVRLFLNDRGRAELTAVVGPGVRSLSGEVDAATDSQVTMSVKESASIRGDVSEWNGERVTIGTALLDSTKIQRFSVARSAAAAAGGAAFVALVRSAFSGGSNGGSSPGSGPPSR